MGKNLSRICKDCNNCIPFLIRNISSEKYTEFVETPGTNQDYPKAITEEQPLEPKSSIDPSEFLQYYSVPIDQDSEKLLDKDNCQVFGQLTNDWFLLKSVWYSKFSPEQILNFLRNLDQRKNWDKNIEKIEEIPSNADSEFFTYMKFKKVLTISQRDSLIISNIIQREDGILIISKSAELASYPEHDSITRMKIFIAGYYFSVTNEQSLPTKVFSLTKADFRGVISHKLVQRATALALPKMFQLMEQYMEKFYPS